MGFLERSSFSYINIATLAFLPLLGFCFVLIFFLLLFLSFIEVLFTYNKIHQFKYTV